MKFIIAAALSLCSALAHAGVYNFMSSGELPTDGTIFPSGWLHGDDHPAQDGTDVVYGLSAPPDPNWLICEYDARRRIKGRWRSGHEWGQRMEGHGEKLSFIRLAPKDVNCTLRTREVKGRSARKSSWTASATCTK